MLALAPRFLDLSKLDQTRESVPTRLCSAMYLPTQRQLEFPRALF